jgi:hypothetical protein
VALNWARRVISEHDRLVPAPAVVVRRALSVYVAYVERELMADSADPWALIHWRAECQRISECARGRRVDREAWDRAAEALDSDEPIKPLRELLADPDAAPISEALLARGREPLPAPGRPPTRCKRRPSRKATPTLPSRATEDPRPPQDHDDE